MTRWFRFYDDVVNDPKVQRLSPELFKAWVNILCVASKNDGKLPEISEISFTLRIKPERAYKILGDLRLAGLLEDVGDEENTVTRPHNWNGRQFKSDVTDPTAPERMKRYRNNRKSVTPNTVTQTVTVTPTRAETEQNTETEKKEDCPKRVRTPYPEAFSKFWKAYPITQIMSKKVAFTEWQRLSEEDRAAAFEAVAPFIAWLKAQKDHPVVHACRFLSQRRFDGFREAPEESDKREKNAQFMAERGWEWREGKWQKKPTDDLPDRVPDFKSMAAANTKAA